jgi:hypothetical protein
MIIKITAAWSAEVLHIDKEKGEMYVLVDENRVGVFIQSSMVDSVQGFDSNAVADSMRISASNTGNLNIE